MLTPSAKAKYAFWRMISARDDVTVEPMTTSDRSSPLEGVDIPPGHRVTREGVPGAEAYVIVEGEADVFVDGETVGTVGPGAVVGEITALDNGFGSATVRARTPMHLLVLRPTRADSDTEVGS